MFWNKCSGITCSVFPLSQISDIGQGFHIMNGKFFVLWKAYGVSPDTWILVLGLPLTLSWAKNFTPLGLSFSVRYEIANFHRPFWFLSFKKIKFSLQSFGTIKKRERERCILKCFSLIVAKITWIFKLDRVTISIHTCVNCNFYCESLGKSKEIYDVNIKLW